MLYIDNKYASILGAQLRNFRQVKPYLWNFSCPVCGDSSTNKTRARGYIFTIKNELVYKCHNCGLSCNFGNLLKRVNSVLYDEYVLERYKENASKYTDHKDVGALLPKETAKVVEWEDEVLSSLHRLDRLDKSHPAVQYLIKRKIPEKFWSKLYFAPKFKAFVNSVEPKFQEPIVDEHPRMIIPYFNQHGKCFAFQGRAYGDEQPKYIELGYNVVMYPDNVEEKDINDMILAGRTQDEIIDLINTNTFSGMEAKLKFVDWKKV